MWQNGKVVSDDDSYASEASGKDENDPMYDDMLRHMPGSQRLMRKMMNLIVMRRMAYPFISQIRLLNASI